jgi:hypothetical protein
MKPDELYAKIQPFVQKEATDIASKVYQTKGTRWGVPEVPFHEHTGVDSSQIPYDNLQQKKVVVSHTLVGTTAATAANYGTFWTAPFACTVIGFTEVHETAGTNGGAVTLQLERLQGTEAPGAGDELLITALNLKATANTVQQGNLTLVRSGGIGLVNLSQGDRLALKDAGTLTNMKTFTTLKNLFTNLSNNTATTNDALGGQLISDQHRYLLQRYFDNERTYTTVTIGAEDLTTTGALSVGAVSATLTGAWTDITVSQLVVFSSGEQRTVLFTQGSTAITWQTGLTEAATTAIETVGVQSYPIPANVSKIKNNTITVGQLVYTPAPVQSIQEWTMLNALPYTSDIPNYFYIYNNQVNFWPIPSTSGNIISFNYKARVPDLSFADYSTGTLSSIAVGDNTITGTLTAWNTTGAFPLNTDLTWFNLYLRITPPSGDGIWYPIQSFQSDTALTLATPIQTAPSATASAYTIGQLPLLSEDFHDMLVYGALSTYHTSIVKDADKFEMYNGMYQQRLDLLKDYAGTKSVNVDLGAQPTPNNPNLFFMGSS